MLYCTFVLLIKKGGGIRPNDVLATCAYKVLHSIPIYWEKISLRGNPSRLLHKPIRFEYSVLQYSDFCFNSLRKSQYAIPNGYQRRIRKTYNKMRKIINNTNIISTKGVVLMAEITSSSSSPELIFIPMVVASLICYRFSNHF